MAVEITCPQCAYTRSIPEGKIPPGVKWATCPRCKNRFEFSARSGSIPEMQTLEAAPGRIDPPWEKRSELGFWAALYATIKSALFSPRLLFATMHFRAGVRDPFAFGLLCGVVGTLWGIFWQFLMVSGSIQSYANIGQVGMGIAFMFILILCIPYVLFILVVTSLILHGCLRLVGGAKNGFEATFRVIAYSQATQIVSFVPVLGGIAAIVWLLVVQMIGLREMHETSYGRIVIAYLIPFLLLVGGIVVAVMFLSLAFWRS